MSKAQEVIDFIVKNAEPICFTTVGVLTTGAITALLVGMWKAVLKF